MDEVVNYKIYKLLVVNAVLSSVDSYLSVRTYWQVSMIDRLLFNGERK